MTLSTTRTQEQEQSSTTWCAKENADLRDKVQKLELAASQSAQNAYIAANQDAQTAELIRRINPMPVPAYNVPAPYPYSGYGNGCGCGC